MNNPGQAEYEFDVQKSIHAQLNAVKESGFPHFAPKSGVCEKCNQNIYEQVKQPKSLFWNHSTDTIVTGIPTVRASRSLIIKCPHCHHDFAPDTFEI
ncbi:hypothetical protein [Cytobacillus firmus]|uniref:hypothetical protein n=1 Tax=Cytobacillus firmus TaxID=1399 RepID=UPI0018CFCB5E|nr:hypothetical protein [Cytobacillus firmus]MBG9656067.1 hypothetical protein [Cytobacillus firmus]MED1907863.1 hypothetical protein [Cytobacillus firmus]